MPDPSSAGRAAGKAFWETAGRSVRQGCEMQPRVGGVAGVQAWRDAGDTGWGQEGHGAQEGAESG